MSERETEIEREIERERKRETETDCKRLNRADRNTRRHIEMASDNSHIATQCVCICA